MIDLYSARVNENIKSGFSQFSISMRSGIVSSRRTKIGVPLGNDASDVVGGLNIVDFSKSITRPGIMMSVNTIAGTMSLVLTQKIMSKRSLIEMSSDQSGQRIIGSMKSFWIALKSWLSRSIGKK